MRTAILPLTLIVAAVMVTSAHASPDAWQREGWKTDFDQATVDLSEITSGGPPKDGIPSIDKPEFRSVQTANGYADREPVIQVILGEAANAYPLSILTWHEIVNDTIEGIPVAVTYCPLCNAAIVFDRRVDGRVLEFGTTGKLRHSDLVMYDRETETWWQQFTGEAIAGTLVGNELGLVPSRIVSFGEFRAAYPEGNVLVPNDPAARPYGRNPYVNYDSRGTPYPLYKGDLPDGIDPLARVVVARRDAGVIAVALSHLRTQERLQLDDVELRWKEGVASALDHEEIASGRDVGSVEVVDVMNGSAVVHDVTFAFVVFAFHPGTTVLTEAGPLKLVARN